MSSLGSSFFGCPSLYFTRRCVVPHTSHLSDTVSFHIKLLKDVFFRFDSELQLPRIFGRRYHSIHVQCYSNLVRPVSMFSLSNSMQTAFLPVFRQASAKPSAPAKGSRIRSPSSEPNCSISARIAVGFSV